MVPLLIRFALLVPLQKVIFSFKSRDYAITLQIKSLQSASLIYRFAINLKPAKCLISIDSVQWGIRIILEKLNVSSLFMSQTDLPSHQINLWVSIR